MRIPVVANDAGWVLGVTQGRYLVIDCHSDCLRCGLESDSAHEKIISMPKAELRWPSGKYIYHDNSVFCIHLAPDNGSRAL